MADEPNSPAPRLDADAGQAQAPWARSQTFLSTFSTVFRYRIGIGDALLVFAEPVEMPGNPIPRVVEEKVAVTMSWSSMKSLALVLMGAVRAVEEEFGPIPTLPNGGFAQDPKTNTQQTLSQMTTNRTPL
jgi:hypothetical protein